MTRRRSLEWVFNLVLLLSIFTIAFVATYGNKVLAMDLVHLRVVGIGIEEGTKLIAVVPFKDSILQVVQIGEILEEQEQSW
ncbi:hypothetical protein B0H11DRAFT_1966905 [Mycena galericulata]|nr:hypothetical protein B0H11DRAFT_1966905 [Mycena galericulata]